MFKFTPLKRLLAGIISAAIVAGPVAGLASFADSVYSINASAVSVTKGETAVLTATFYVDGEPITEDEVGEGKTYRVNWYDSDLGLNVGDVLSVNIDTTEIATGDYWPTINLFDSSWNKIENIQGNWPKLVINEPSDDNSGGQSDSDDDSDVAAAYSITLSEDSYEMTKESSYTFSATITDPSGNELSELSGDTKLWWWVDIWNTHTDGQSACDLVKSNGEDYSLSCTFTPNAVGTYYLAVEPGGMEGLTIRYITITVTEASDDSDDDPVDVPIAVPVSGDINFDGVPTLPSDFFMGVDVSSVVSLYDAGVRFKDYNGNELSTVNAFIAFLASQGVNCVRVRVWNNPYDANGNGYGGGNNDVDKAKIIADACEAAGITMLVDFHLSDFWCDPEKQYAPVAWSSMTVVQRAEAVADFITSSLDTIDPNKNTVVMVQVGNETNNGVCGVTDHTDMCTIFDRGCDAVHTWNPATRAVLHFTNPEEGTLASWASTLSSNNVSADILATSYYPYWHGTLSNLTSQLSTAKRYGFDVMVAETSYAYTLDDTDGHENTVRVGTNDTGDNLNHPFTVQGQARSVRDVVDAVNNAGGIGMFYWEPAWITVGDTTGLEGDDYDAQVAANKLKWERYGCGWASSYAGTYDPADAGRWYGGSAVDGEAFFYPDGTPTDAWGVYTNIRNGEYTTAVSPEVAASFAETTPIGGSYSIPEKTTVTYNNDTTADLDVTWNEEDMSLIDVNTIGTYVVRGTVEGLNVTYTLNVEVENLIDSYVAGFEVSNSTPYTIEGDGIAAPRDEDPRSGSKSAHWYLKDSAVDGSITLVDTFTISDGEYTFTGYAQGDTSSNITFRILDADTDEILASSETVTLDGWKNWMTSDAVLNVTEETEVKLCVVISYGAGGWGTVDDLKFYRSGDAQTEEEPEAEPTETPTATPTAAPTATPAAAPTVAPTTAPVSSPSSVSVTTSAAAPVVSGIISSGSGLVNVFYNILLGRDADQTGYDYWNGKLESGEISFRELINGFLFSSEYLDKNKSDEEFVSDLYRAILNREPDEEGLEYWLGRLASDATRDDVIDGFIHSEEFIAIAADNGYRID